MRVVYLTSTGLRHTAFLDSLTTHWRPSLIVREPKKPAPPSTSSIVEAYRSTLNESEIRYFGGSRTSRYPCIVTEPGQVCHPDVIEKIRAAKPEILLVFGTSLLDRQVLTLPSSCALNLHTGITQLLRGVDSYFWAIHDDCPEAIGATVHLIDSSIDGGAVVSQARADIEAGDTLPDLFHKSVQVGFETMVAAVQEMSAGNAHPAPLVQRGKLYHSRDMTEAALMRAEEKRADVLRNYLMNRAKRDTAAPILSAFTSPGQSPGS